MPEPRHCPVCGADLPPDASSDMCPGCLMRAALEDSSSAVGRVVPDNNQIDETIDSNANLAELSGGRIPPTLNVGLGETGASDEQTLDSEADVADTSSGRLGRGERIKYFGDYEIIEEIARGGMGVVYKARQVKLDRVVALKMILGGQLADETAVQRFYTEAQAAAKLDHVGIVPIFEVGDHEGQHFFSMGLIEGESLADRLRDGPLPPKEAARLMLQAAEAVAYAHKQDVVHRDIKPANVLIDRDGQPKITDFGLAKRTSDDSGMTATGQILGTPSYMPPEQAAGKTDEIGPLADVYSLGATLYATLTGRPPFQAANIMDTLKQVLEQEPAAPRRLNLQIPKDLETICLKCLEKDPADRYGSASDLAEDLRRYLDDEPIVARPIGVFEQSWRWIRKRRRSVLIAMIATSAALFMAIGAAFVWNSYTIYQRSFLTVWSDFPQLRATLLDGEGKAVTDSLALPAETPIELTAGDYRLHLSQGERLTQDYEFALQREEDAQFDVDLEDQRLWDIADVPSTHTWLRFPDGNDLIEMNASGILRRDGATGRLLWSRELVDEATLASASSAGWRWPWRTGDHEEFLRPQLLQDLVDLNGDGRLDLIVAARHQGWLLALSGADGSLLWTCVLGQDVRSPPGDASIAYSAVLGAPDWLGDIDDDQVPDLVATAAEVVPISQTEGSAAWSVVALSGATGDRLWRFAPKESGDRPVSLQFLTQVTARSVAEKHVATVSQPDNGQIRVEYKRPAADSPGRPRYGSNSARIREGGFFPTPARVISSQAGEAVVLIANWRVLRIDPQSGRQLPTSDDRDGELIGQDRSGPRRWMEAKWTDPDTDGFPDLLYHGQQLVSMWSMDKQKWLWEKAQRLYAWGPNWPLVVDLDGDGRAEMVYQQDYWEETQRNAYMFGGSVVPRCMLQVLEASSGEVRWQRPFASMDAQVEMLRVGPDIDQDGCRDLFAATLLGEHFDLHVDALSGRYGTSLWTHRERLLPRPPSKGFETPLFQLESISWAGVGCSGWPQLFVSVRRNDHEQHPAFFFDAARGVLTRSTRDLPNLRAIDVDGDTAPELVSYRAAGGRLRIIEGAAAEDYRRLGQLTLVGDLDRDGVRDWVDDAQWSVNARSGTTRQVLWQSPRNQLNGVSRGAQAAPVPDVDGDETDDVLIYNPSKAAIVSGRTGQPLWTKPYISVYADCGFPALRPVDIDNDGRGEVVCITRNQLEEGHVLMLCLMETTSDQTRWQTTLCLTAKPVRVDLLLGGPHYPLTAADVNGDSVKDLILPVIDDTNRSVEWRALNGADGSTIWSRTGRGPKVAAFETLVHLPAPAIADLDKDGQPEILVLEVDETPGADARVARLRALNAHDGSERWIWEQPFSSSAGQPRRALDVRPPKRSRIEILSTSQGPNICVDLAGRERRIFQLDASGRERAQVTVDSGRSPFRVLDVDGDGQSEILLITGGGIRLADDDVSAQPVWHADLPASVDAGIVDVLQQGERWTCVVQNVHNRLLGVDVATGKIVWTCSGPRPRDGDGNIREVASAAMSVPNSDETPLLCFQYKAGDGAADGDNAVVAVCRRAIPADDVLQIPRRPCVLRPVGRDARLLRPLPWVRDSTMEPWNALMSCLTGVAIFILPVGYIYLLVRDRRWSLARLFLLPAIVLLAIGSVSWNQPRLAVVSAVGHLPLVAFAFVVVHHLVRRQWRSLRWWLGGMIVASIASATFSCLADQPVPGLAYSWSGWYLAGLRGAFLCGSIVILVTPPSLLWKAVRGRKADEAEDELDQPVAPSRVVSIVAAINFVFGGLQIAGLIYSIVSIVDRMGQTEQLAAVSVLEATILSMGSILTTLAAGLAVAAGVGVMRRRKWGRVLTMVLGFAAVPFGLLSCNMVSAVAALPYSLAVVLLILIYNKQFANECR